VLDAETAPSMDQGLLFLSYRLCRVRWRGWTAALSCVEEGLVYGDDLRLRDPAGFAVLQAYARAHAPAVDRGVLDATYGLRFHSRSEFVEEVLYPAALQPGGPGAWIVAFGAAWDLSRLVAPHLPVTSTGWAARAGYEAREPSGDGPARKGRTSASRFLGGFSIPVWEYEERPGDWRERRPYRPRLAIKHLGTRKNLYGWIGSGSGEGAAVGRGAGEVLDLLTLAAAMTGESQTLESACTAFGFAYQDELDRLRVPTTKRTIRHGVITSEYVGYNRADTAATARLAGAILAEYSALGVETSPTQVFSAASLAKDTLDRLGVRPLLDRQPDFDAGVMGSAMVALYGGRTECHVRRTQVPVTVTDLVSQYPTVSILLGLQEFLTCERVDVVAEDPAELEAWLGGLTLDAVLDPATWRAMRGIALVDLADDVLPIRTDWHGDGTLGVGLPIVHRGDTALWWAIPDLVASVVRTGRAPRVLAVRRFTPVGQAAGLRAIRFGSTVEIDLRRDNLYRALIEDRARAQAEPSISAAERRRLDLGLKVIANSLYGITAEVRPSSRTTGTRAIAVHGLRSFTTDDDEPEEPGRFFFAPQAALTTAGGRLLLMLIERLVTDAGGTWCYADTDSAAVISSATGGPVACRTPDGTSTIYALSFEEVARLVQEPLNRLNPYDRALVPELLKIEKVNFEGGDPGRSRRDLRAYAVAAKKYVLTNIGHGDRREVIDWAVGGDLDAAAPDSGIVDRREHGLGYLRNPIDPRRDPDGRDWVTEAWAYTLAIEAGQRPRTPAWFDRPQMSRNATLSTPRQLRAFGARNQGRRAADAVKPFNFLNRVFVDEQELSSRLRGLVLAAPYNDDPGSWLTDDYVAIHELGGRTYRITTERVDPDVGDDGSGRIRVHDYGDLVRSLPLHPESKSLGPDGAVCGPQTHGLLSRRTIEIGTAVHVGKESTQLSGDGLEGAWRRVKDFREPGHGEWETALLPALHRTATAVIARGLGVDRSTVKRRKVGTQRPRKGIMARLRSVRGRRLNS
jgi:hypothetical protein